MFNKWRKYSYAAQKDRVHRIRWFFVWFGAFFLAYVTLTAFFFSTRRLENESMQPALRSGDQFIFSSHIIYRFLPDSAGAGRLRRGNIVLVNAALRQKQNIPVLLLDLLARFCTAQQLSLTGRGEHYFIKRVIGLPGDEISMTNFVVRVKPAGNDYPLTEFERSERVYDVTIPQTPALWDRSLPFSGNMEPVVLGDNECFVLSDDRSNTNDSRTWGPLHLDLITGKALFRYWPLSRLGIP